MTSFYVTLGVVAVCGLLWLMTQLSRLRQAPRLLALLGLLAFWALSWPFGLAANAGFPVWGLDRLDARTVEHAVRLVATACLLAFILATPVPRRSHLATKPRGAAVWWWQAGLLCAAVLALSLNTAATPTELRDQLAELANGSAVSGEHTPVGSAFVARFFLIENIYYAGAFALGTVWVARHLRRRPLPTALAAGLRLLLLGSITLVAATIALTGSVLTRWSGEEPPQLLNLFGLTALGAGLLIIVAGLAAPSIVSALDAVKILREHRRTARKLEPLWAQLRDLFPGENAPQEGGDAAPGPGRAQYSGTAGHATGSPLLDRLSHRYYRILIECRDGLHRLSPYLHATTDAGDPTALPTGAQLLDAVELCRSDSSAHGDAPAVGRPPAESSFGDDVEVLVMLSRRLQAAQNAATATEQPPSTACASTEDSNPPLRAPGK